MITIQFNDEALQAGLDRLARAVTDLTPLMQDIGEEMVVSTKDRFLAGVSPEGVAWAPKSQTTIDQYRRRRDPVDLRPLIGPSRRLSSEIQWQASATEVEWGSNLIQAAVMQFGAAKGAFGNDAGGSPIPWGTIPARPFLGLADEDRSGIEAALEEWLTRAWGPD